MFPYVTLQVVCSVLVLIALGCGGLSIYPSSTQPVTVTGLILSSIRSNSTPTKKPALQLVALNVSDQFAEEKREVATSYYGVLNSNPRNLEFGLHGFHFSGFGTMDNNKFAEFWKLYEYNENGQSWGTVNTKTIRSIVFPVKQNLRAQPNERLIVDQQETAKILPELDLLAFHSPSSSSSTMEKLHELHPRMILVQVSMEGVHYFPSMETHFDNIVTASVTYRVSKDLIPIVYTVPEILGVSSNNSNDYLRDPVERKAAKNAAVYVARNGNAKNRRGDYVKRMRSAGFEVDGISADMHNAEWPVGVGRDDKYGALRLYKFYCAFENGNLEDYVTEKVYHSFIAGVIPIYMGAPNVRDFVPVNSTIFVDDYETVEDLVAHLKNVAEGPIEIWNSYFEWRKNPEMVAHIQKKLGAILREPWETRVARFALGLKQGLSIKNWDKEKQNWKA